MVRARPRLRHALRLTVATMTAAAGATRVSAQVIVSGVVTDSLRGQPLAGAVVQIVAREPRGPSWRTEADSLGRFRFAGVDEGQYLVGFVHPRLDSLGLEVPPRSLELSSGDTLRRMMLAIPSARTIVTAVCGAVQDSSGLYLGRVLDGERAPVPGAKVIVRWREIVAPGRGRAIHVEEQGLEATTDEGGRFVVCGVPAAAPLLVQATSSVGRSGAIAVEVPPAALLHRDLFVGAPVDPATAQSRPQRRGSARVAGIVRDRDGHPITGATVLVLGGGVADSLAHTDGAGHFELAGLPAGTYTLEVRAIGHHPARVAVDLDARRATTTDLTLGARVATLEPVRVYSAATPLDVSGFTQRSRGAFGRFLTAKDVERLHPATVPDLLRAVPGIHVVPEIVGSRIYGRGIANGASRCQPAVYVDGVLAVDGANALDAYVQPSEVLGIEVYVDVGTVPVEYQHGECGTIIVWTKRGPPSRR